MEPQDLNQPYIPGLEKLVTETLIKIYQEENPGLLTHIQQLAITALTYQAGEAFIMRVCPISLSPVIQNHLLVLFDHYFKLRTTN